MHLQELLMGALGTHHKILLYGLDCVWGYDSSKQFMRELFELFSYDQNAAKNEELFRMRYESSIKPGSKDAFATMFFDSRQERLDKLAFPDEEIKRLTQKLYYSTA